jgi:ATP-binding cassette subfamily F protein uup
MHQISLENIDKAYPETPVLSGVSLGISAGQRIGIIGRNGSGKSTLLRIIAGTEEPDAGEIVRAVGLTVTALWQNPTFPGGVTVADVTLGNRQAISLADRLGLTDSTATVAELSGGQRKKLALAVTLAAESHILILDEPTNHLDVDTIDWLEDHLSVVTSTLILVTHDRYLLDRIATRVVEVHEHDLHAHQGTYSDYLETRANREALEATAAQKHARQLKTELAWLRRNPKARTSKSRARVKRVENLAATRRASPRSELVIDLPTRRIGSKVVNLHNVGKTYDARVVLSGVTTKLAPDARIGIVGPNGAGKTTLLALIASQIEQDEGKVTTGSTIVSGWYGQDPSEIPPDTRVISAVRAHGEQTDLEGGKTISAPKLLELFQFTRNEQQATVGDLSGGERRRLELLLVLMGSPNLLLLDEPTNDLDLDTLHTLEDYLDTWDGAMVVASHDRYFLDRVCDDIFSIEADGSVRHHPGGWSAYWETRVQPRRTKPQAGGAQRPKQERRKLTYNDSRELALLTKQIPKLERRRTTLISDLNERSGDPAAAADLGQQLEEIMYELDTAETRWLELTELAEALKSETQRG